MMPRNWVAQMRRASEHRTDRGVPGEEALGVPNGEQETEGPDPRRGVRGSALSPQGGGSDAQAITGVAEGHPVVGGFHLGEDFLQSQIPAVVEEFVKIRPAVFAGPLHWLSRGFRHLSSPA